MCVFLSPLTLTFSRWDETALSPRDEVSQRVVNEYEAGHFRIIPMKENLRKIILG